MHLVDVILHFIDKILLFEDFQLLISIIPINFAETGECAVSTHACIENENNNFNTWLLKWCLYAARRHICSDQGKIYWTRKAGTMGRTVLQA